MSDFQALAVIPVGIGAHIPVQFVLYNTTEEQRIYRFNYMRPVISRLAIASIVPDPASLVTHMQCLQVSGKNFGPSETASLVSVTVNGQPCAVLREIFQEGLTCCTREQGGNVVVVIRGQVSEPFPMVLSVRGLCARARGAGAHELHGAGSAHPADYHNGHASNGRDARRFRGHAHWQFLSQWCGNH